ncbi:MAG: aldehyde dehydrogenase family protein, partial [Novosphingobium sp.]
MMYHMLIDGELVSGNGDRDVDNPVDETIVASIPDADIAMMDRAVAAARRSWPAWRDTPIEQRAAVLRKMSTIVTEHSAELAGLLIKETGRPQGVAAFEMGLCTQFLDYFAEQRLDPEVIADEPHRRVEAHRKPLGVVAAIVPWNAPLYIAINKIAPALIAGNTIVVKPAPTTPLATLRLAELLADAAPKGVLNIVSGGNEVGAHLV